MFTGFNESQIPDRGIAPYEIRAAIESGFKLVLFRGSYTREAGHELISEVAKSMIEYPIRFVIITPKFPKEISFPSNSILIDRRISNEEMKFVYDHAELCIGQVTERPRLKNTIPHKAFEAAYFSKPYITADVSGIREFLTNSNQCIFLKDISVRSLGEAIIEIVENRVFQRRLSTGIHKRYLEVGSQEILGIQFLSLLKK